MPSQKLTEAPALRPATAKSGARPALVSKKVNVGEDVHTEARRSHTREVLATARRREIEMEKQGYWF
jgi:hypothetical protein